MYYAIDISANVPLYGQKKGIWCGAAVAQMARNGYPNLGDRMLFAQQCLWDIIQLKNSKINADVGSWNTDPHGMQGCLQSLSTAPVSWIEYPRRNPAEALFYILYGMKLNRFPSPVVVNNGDHWVLVVGWKTNVEPIIKAPRVTLKEVHFYDPQPPATGSDTTWRGTKWHLKHWKRSISMPGTWLNQYVAIVNAPVANGEVTVDTENYVSHSLAEPMPYQQAQDWSQHWIDEMQLAERPQYALLGNPQREALPPLLVRDEPDDETPDRAPYYWIVPYGLRNDPAELGGPLARVCVLVDAYTGDFEEVTAFGKPLRYLPEQEAVNVVAAALDVPPEHLDAKATLMFQTSEITHVHTWPFWQVIVGDRAYYVDQDRGFYRGLSAGARAG